jgi:hypothetical protein
MILVPNEMQFSYPTGTDNTYFVLFHFPTPLPKFNIVNEG